MIVGYTTGVFDLFHIGHLNILKNAKENCDHLIVGVTTDELVFSRKNKYPVIPIAERLDIVRAIKYVDAVVVQNSMKKIEAWETLRFHRMFVGDDWKGTSTWQELEVAFSELDVEIVYFPYTKHTSSTKLKEALEKLN
ncbi:adenylyltransferase/cytidyltransferase family protein [Enterovibrio norvegicus]|uniref:Adenylyltransferase/cytidyltransferase family protein n=1 Tax=Enterovibrio norvegicus TaxID=188144 RepID=A0ABV4KYK6_9GAMM|nr:adenylyltransferase/cytidyltransferase family protein [Enterovibrio norvegicus]OEF58805.1 glycerol-3-phosphate cytidylyltransferase [Enterovibrio norvegicus]